MLPFYHTQQAEYHSHWRPPSLPLAGVGSPKDVESRIRRFYTWWLQRVSCIPSESDLSPFQIDIEREHPSADTPQSHDREEEYTVSGFVVEGFYQHLDVPPEGGQLIIDSAQIPLAFARSAPRHRRKVEAQRRSDEQWEEAGVRQKHPIWRRTDKSTEPLAKSFCFPRCMVLQPSCATSGDPEPSMNRWIRNFDRAFHPYSAFPDRGVKDYWEQLPGDPNLPEERAKGSPSTSLISRLRLSIIDDSQLELQTIKSIRVTFKVVQDVNGPRPWRRQPTPRPLVALDPVPHLPVPQYLQHRRIDVHSLLSPQPREPHFQSSQQTSRGSCNLADYRSRLFPPPPPPLSSRPSSPVHLPPIDHRHQHSLNHRQRKVYGQDFARSALEDRFADLRIDGIAASGLRVGIGMFHQMEIRE